MKQKKILIISFSDLKNDPRVNRQIRFFSAENRVFTLGNKDAGIEHVSFFNVGFPLHKIKYAFQLLLLFFRQFELFYRSLENIKKAKAYTERDFDLIIANDVDALPLALSLKTSKTKVVFDAHEYSPREHDNSFIWRFLFKPYKTYLLKQYAPKADLMFTVCDGIAEEYSKEFGLPCKVITNASEFTSIEPGKVTDKIRIIHHGLAHPSRKMENMIQAMHHVDSRFELTFMLVSHNQAYINQLKKLAEGLHNVKFIPPVNMKEIVPHISSYDIGMYLLEPTNFNNKHALPNKFFEFIQARLMIVIGPSPEMKTLTERHQLGIVTPDFQAQSLAKALNALDADSIQQYKQKADKAAHILNAKANLELMNSEIEKILI